jgi:hypothetical protein
MIGLYLAIIMAWMWAVLVFSPGRHMRGIVLLPIFLPVAIALRWLTIGLDLGQQAAAWAYNEWLSVWFAAFDKFDRWMDRPEKGQP